MSARFDASRASEGVRRSMWIACESATTVSARQLSCPGTVIGRSHSAAIALSMVLRRLGTRRFADDSKHPALRLELYRCQSRHESRAMRSPALGGFETRQRYAIRLKFHLPAQHRSAETPSTPRRCPIPLAWEGSPRSLPSRSRPARTVRQHVFGRCVHPIGDREGAVLPRRLGLAPYLQSRGTPACNPHCSLAASAPPTATSCLGAFRTPAASARGSAF
jgi:hypothetical protein